MASRGTALSVLLVAFALIMAGGFMEGVRADSSSPSSSFVRRRLAQHPTGTTAAVVPQNCPITCRGLSSTCCQSSPPLSGYFCANTQIDMLNCGTCGTFCVNSSCCNGKCSNTSSDPKNCGICGRQCAAKETCTRSFCNYAV